MTKHIKTQHAAIYEKFATVGKKGRHRLMLVENRDYLVVNERST